MRKIFQFRRLRLPPFFSATSTVTATAASKPTAISTNQYRYATTDGVNGKTRKSTENNGEWKWFTLPPFSSSVDVNSLGKRITGRNLGDEDGSVTEKMTAIKWILRCCPDLPKSLVQKLFRLRQVRRQFLEGYSGHDAEGQNQLKRVGAKDFMNIGDRIILPGSVKGSSIKKCNYEYSEDELNFVRGLVLYKDSAIIAINKPPKLPVQGGHGIKRSLDELAVRCLRYDNKDPPRLVHRLDRDSSGILVLGRTQTSTAVLHSIFREKTIGISDDKESEQGKRALQKRYLALVLGVPKKLRGMISAPLAKVIVDDGKSERITIVNDASSSQHAVTEYRVIETSTFGYTWLELSPLTGRKHQLRVHCAEVLGTPIVGDYKYGWQAHRNWEPLPCMKPNDEFPEVESHPFSLDLEGGCVSQKQPHLHLHCKQMILPNVSLALKHASDDLNFDFSELDSLNLVAPLPHHMKRSWNLLKSHAK